MTERNGYHYHPREEEEFLTDELDHEILMHRDAHFGGSFDVMQDYYESGKVGTHPDFELDRIEYLAGIEKETRKNLAPLLLSGAEAEEVGRSRRAYQDFKKLYESTAPATRHTRLIADLVLSEEEEPEAEIEAIVDEGESIVPDLIRIVRSEDAYNPLFPGYGLSPARAIDALGRIGDPQAIAPIFESMGRDSLFGDESALQALVEIGESAKEFLLKRVTGRPLTKDHQIAAYALGAFPPSAEIAKVCFEQLKDPAVQRDPLLSSYLLGPCEALEEKEAFIALAKQTSLSRELKTEMEALIRAWGK